ncbi:MAG TPA: sigma 54-interacting transcriptional regulator [Syntrophorhabdaceae bacterium]|nr:sigma 54-interacting transcriptional regulator [Syntrophorhabdaceae bacterium]
MQNEQISLSQQSPEEDFLLSIASMFKGEFSLDWIEELTGMKASKILDMLEREVQGGLLVRIRPAVYAFRNSERRLEQYSRLSTEEKERYHRQMAAIFIRDLHDDDAKALEIAEHLACIPNDATECQWIIRAGEIYAQSLRSNEAMSCFTHVLAQLADKGGANEDWLFIKAAIGYSNVYGGRTNMEQCVAFLKEARERVKSLDKPAYEILLEMHVAKYERLTSHLNEAAQRFEQAISRIKHADDPELAAPITMFRIYFLFWQGQFREVIKVYEKSVPDVEKYPIGHFPIVAGMMVGHCYAMVGQTTQGLGLLDTIRDHCFQKDNRYLAAHADSSISMVMLLINRAEDALRYMKLALKEAQESDNTWIENLVTLELAVAYRHMGNHRECLQHLRKFLRNSSVRKSNLLLYPYLMELGWAMECGELPRVPGVSLDQEIERMLSVKNIFMRGIAYRYKALLQKSKGLTSQEIVNLFNQSAKCLRESGNQIELAKTYFELTRYYLSMANDKKARAAVQLASEIFSSTNADCIPDDLRALVQGQNYERTILTEIVSLTQEVGARHGGGKLLQNIVATVNRITGAERGALLLLEEQREEQKNGPILRLRASKNLTMEQIYDPAFASSRKMIERVITSGTGSIFETDDADGDPLSKQSNPLVRSSICVPLLLEKRVIGVLYHENRLLGNVFRNQDLNLLTFFAALATLYLYGERAHQDLDKILRKERQENFAGQKESVLPGYHESIVGTSPAIRHILVQANHVAKSDAAVLILGETGVGKNLLAEAVHRQSSRANGPFVTVQCSALTESLITSELFGHERGAFTGATNRYVGRIEMADKGTLFMDEIGDLSLEVQARLLRVLQSKEFERVGGGKDVLVSDFRLIAASNRDLLQEIKAGRFREDLYYRINVFPLTIPPLRERREDIPLLVRHFLKVHNASLGTNVLNVKQEVMGTLIRHDWPGNVRELENVVQRGIISSTGSDFRLPPFENAPTLDGKNGNAKTLKEKEREHILGALRETRWKVYGPGGAAELLDINASTLIYRMKKLDIVKPAIYNKRSA